MEIFWILEKLFIEEPNHPGVAHYLIHSYDKPQLAELGLPAARRYAQIAPASPHALHMPSHIFARTGMWQDDIASNLASIEATRKTAAMHMGGAGHQFHAMDYLVYAYLQSGHEADAQKVVDDVRKMTPDSHDGTWDGYYALTKYPALIALEMRHWGDAAKLEVIKGSAPIDLAITYYARTIGAARSGDAKAARKEIANLESTEKSLVGKKGKYGADEVEQLHNIASAWLAHAEGRNEEALKALGQLADKEDAEGPEQTATPVREMLADMLMELNRPQEALAQFETTLKANPGRFNGLYGAAQAAERAGKSEQANTYYARLVKSCEGSGSVRPELDRARTLLAKN